MNIGMETEFVEFKREISQGIANAIKPQIIPIVSIELFDDKNVIKVIAEGEENHIRHMENII